MKFAEIPANILTFRVKQTDAQAAALTEQPVSSVVPCATRPGNFEIGLKDALAIVKPVVEADTRRLNSELFSGGAILAQLVNPAVDGSIEVQIAFFTGDCLDMGDVEVGIDEYVERAYPKITSQKTPGDKLYEVLAKRCSYTQDGQAFFFLVAGAAIDGALRSKQQEGKEENQEEPGANDLQEETDGDTLDSVEVNSSPRVEPTRRNSFCIVGDRIRFVATQTQRPDGKPIYIATRLTKRKTESDRALRLARGKLTFVDWTQAGQIQALTRAQMSALTQDAGSYLSRWDEFVSIEGELLLEQARAVGALQYSSMTTNLDGTVTVRIDHASDSALKALAAKSVESVELAEELPEYLVNLQLTFAQFVGGIEKAAADEAFFGKHRNQRNEAALHFDVAEYDAEARSLTLNTEYLPNAGTFILSLAGHVAQIKRRLFARRAILEGRAANPQLGLLLEEKGEIARTRPPSNIKPLTAFVSDKVFRNPPTDKQREAIDVALNTPDIALIQGPPGTGKTTVIAAIIERLNEIADKRGASIKGVVLLTGLQHDAVENMIDRLSLNGLPVPKFGRRSGNDEDEYTRFEGKLNEWCGSRAAALRAKNPQLSEIEQESQIKNLCLQYLRAPSRALALSLAQLISKLGILILGEDCARQAAYLVRKLSLEERLSDDAKPLLEAVRQLRHRPESFADDGPERAVDALDDLHDVLDAHERDCLDRASSWRNEDGVPPFLGEVEALKKRLLARFAAPPVFRVEKQNEEIMDLAEEAMRRIRIAGFSSKDARSAALSEFLAELESNPYGMIGAVSDYAYAFAATCQQSVNRQMQKQKGIGAVKSAEEFQRLEYEYVIVDEAARVTPPDLLVAMAQGKRIILVGDHRQLPHIVDEDVITKLSTDDEDDLLAEEGKVERDEAEWSKISLFEHMFVTRLPALEKHDGIPRRVTLDRQYRMHPVLGNFVSRNFYERFDKPGGQTEAFGSGRPESDFRHALPDTDGKPAIWLDVPLGKGKHERVGTSWIRRAEATAIAHQLQAWLNSTEGQGLSFGVISFYKAQAELIKRQLGTVTDDGKKLRIGTVDSFQGMEFDVVFLSMVRTLPPNWHPRSDDEELQARGLFGHLCLYNRLNVAMSRQKKLLVVSGDSGLLRSDLAMRHVPGLVDYLRLCEIEGRVLACR